MDRPGAVITTVVTGDTTLKSTNGKVWWVSLNNTHATDNAAIEIQDGSTDRWATIIPGLDTPTDSHLHIIFDPPIFCTTDVRIDITGGTVLATVAFT